MLYLALEQCENKTAFKINFESYLSIESRSNPSCSRSISGNVRGAMDDLGTAVAECADGFAVTMKGAERKAREAGRRLLRRARAR